ncbi:uncharacterized protein LOC132558001 [Ylistrum balloti]|uniref:uncharacterized protein LOC132558001 n=1 Tax=Ylistrum balloti TaxID=509963 RepID=UPI002905E59A|nr:uncharacterized protein LOC132558001 [Ylistrum balloti]
MTSEGHHLGPVHHGKEWYSSAMESSRKVIKAFNDKVMQCVEDMLRPERNSSGTVCIAEFGSADGGVSLELINGVIDYINQSSKDPREILLVYEDQLLNDYNVLFKTIHGTSTNASTKLSTRENVHLLASATSMYRQCLPSGFVDISFSSMANQWLSKKPCHIRGGIFQTDCSPEELEAFQHQWQTDWKLFLSCRARELRPGGFLVVISFVTGDSGRDSDIDEEDIHDVFTSTWKDFLKSGKITEEEFVNSSKITYSPTANELIKPFHTDMKGSLTLVDCTQKDVHIIPGFANEDGIKERENFVNRSLKCARPWLYNILKSGLSSNRTEAEKGKLLDDYFQMLSNILMQKTSFSPLYYKTACVVAKRTLL